MIHHVLWAIRRKNLYRMEGESGGKSRNKMTVLSTLRMAVTVSSVYAVESLLKLMAL